MISSKFLNRAAAAALGLGILASGSATALDVGTYELNNHPDGNAAPPLYGLRLDNLIGTGVYTFDFAHDQSDVTLDFDGSTVRVQGDVYGGTDGGNAYSGEEGTWHVDFTYDTNVVVGNPGDQVHLKVTGNNSNFGTLTSVNVAGVADGTVYDSRDKSDGSRTFLLSENYRNFNTGLSGAGWMEWKLQSDPDTAYTAAGATDWLFTIGNTVGVPEPGSLVLLLSGVVVLRIARRRRV